MSRFTDRVDEMADRLQDAAETFRERRDELLRQLEEAKDAFIDECFAADDWAVDEGLIESVEWVDADGEPFLPWVRTEVHADEIPDMGTLFRERVESLVGDEEKSESGDES